MLDFGAIFEQTFATLKFFWNLLLSLGAISIVVSLGVLIFVIYRYFEIKGKKF